MSNTHYQTDAPTGNQSVDTDAEITDDSSALPDSDTEKAPSPKAWGSDAPDGGMTAWLVILGVWCTSFCSFGWLNGTFGLVSCLSTRLFLLTRHPPSAVGTFQAYYEQELLSDYSPSTVSWIPSLQIFFLMGLVSFHIPRALPSESVLLSLARVPLWA